MNTIPTLSKSPTPQETLRILIVEDEIILAHRISRDLTSLGYQVVDIASSGESAVELAHSGEADLVLMDIKLKGEMDGIAAAEQIRKRFNIPVVYLTAFSDTASLERAKTSDPFGYVIKPVSSRELHAAIDLALYRHHLETQLKDSEKRYRNLFESVPLGIYRSTPDGRILDGNPAFRKMLGYPDQATMLTSNVKDLFINGDIRQQQLSLIEQKEGVSSHILQLRRHDGILIWVQDSAKAIRNEAGQITHYYGSLEDITERVQAKDKLEHYTKQLETLTTINAALSSSLALDEVLNLILDQIRKMIPFDSSAVFLVEDEGLRIVMDRGITPSLIGQTFPCTDTLFQEIKNSQQPLVLTNAQEDTRFLGWGNTEYTKSWLGVPLIEGEELLGYMTLDSKQVAVYDASDAKLAQSFAVQAAQAIRNARLYNKSKQLAAFNQDIIESMTEGIIIDNRDGFLTFVNPAAAKMLGYITEECIGLHWMDIIPPDQHHITEDVNERRRRGESDRYEIEMMKKDRSRISAFISGCPRFDEEGQFSGTLAIISNITKRKSAEDKLLNANKELQIRLGKIRDLESALREQTIRDPLTGLYNRRHMKDALKLELAKAANTGQPLSIVILDLDNLKKINDSYGHMTGGDQAIVALTKILDKQCRADDIACRYAGDEFLIILSHTPASVARKRTLQWKESVEKIKITAKDTEFGITFSAGIAEYPTHASTEEELTIKADQALYQAKSQKHNRVVIFGEGER